MQTIARKFSQTNENKVVVVWYSISILAPQEPLCL